jgi:transglutaminase-like putative cysteine protease
MMKNVKTVNIALALVLAISVTFGIPNVTTSNPEIGPRGTLSWFDINANIFKIKYVLPLNMSSNTNITMDICVPGNDDFQRILSTDFDPSPNSTFIDGAGLVHVRYELATRSPEFLNITANYTALIIFSTLTGDFSQAQNLEIVPADILENYTQPAPYIESDNPAILGNATKLTANATDVESKINSLFNFVANEGLFTYDAGVQNITRNASDHVRGALWALQNHRGVCFDFACLFVALLRAVKIPSRISEGIILDGRSGFIIHDWAEVYLAGVGWIPYDPTWNQAKDNLHMKILNPAYDTYLRWNYSIQSGWLYNFPQGSQYAVNDQVNIIDQTFPNIVDSIVLGDSNANITRTLGFQNETISSSTDVSNSDETIENFYGALHTDLSDDVGIRTINYAAYFSPYSPSSLQVNIIASWNLIFSGSLLPTIGNVNCLSVSKPLQFVLVEPLLWVGIILIISIASVVLALWVRRRHHLARARSLNERAPTDRS